MSIVPMFSVYVTFSLQVNYQRLNLGYMYLFNYKNELSVSALGLHV